MSDDGSISRPMEPAEMLQVPVNHEHQLDFNTEIQAEDDGIHRPAWKECRKRYFKMSSADFVKGADTRQTRVCMDEPGSAHMRICQSR